jgi:hypothetical protein
MPARIPPPELHEAEDALVRAMEANREARRLGRDAPYGAGALLVLQRRVKAALAEADSRADGLAVR